MHRTLTASLALLAALAVAPRAEASLLEFQIPEKVVMDKDGDFYGRFAVGPLTPGFGAAIGAAVDAVARDGFEDGDVESTSFQVVSDGRSETVIIEISTGGKIRPEQVLTQATEALTASFAAMGPKTVVDGAVPELTRDGEIEDAAAAFVEGVGDALCDLAAERGLCVGGGRKVQVTGNTSGAVAVLGVPTVASGSDFLDGQTMYFGAVVLPEAGVEVFFGGEPLRATTKGGATVPFELVAVPLDVPRNSEERQTFRVFAVADGEIVGEDEVVASRDKDRKPKKPRISKPIDASSPILFVGDGGGSDDGSTTTVVTVEGLLDHGGDTYGYSTEFELRRTGR